MKYYKILQYGDDENYSTKETIIDEVVFQQYRKLIAEGKEKLVLQDRIISVSSIKEILPANDVVAEYQRQGLQIKGLIEPPDRPQITGEVRKRESIGEYIKRTKTDFFKRMDWN